MLPTTKGTPETCSLSLAPSDVPVTPDRLGELDRRSEALDRDVAKEGALGCPASRPSEPT
jgi:hypothetical protein